MEANVSMGARAHTISRGSTISLLRHHKALTSFLDLLQSTIDSNKFFVQ